MKDFIEIYQVGNIIDDGSLQSKYIIFVKSLKDEVLFENSIFSMMTITKSLKGEKLTPVVEKKSLEHIKKKFEIKLDKNPRYYSHLSGGRYHDLYLGDSLYFSRYTLIRSLMSQFSIIIKCKLDDTIGDSEVISLFRWITDSLKEVIGPTKVYSDMWCDMIKRKSLKIGVVSGDKNSGQLISL